jgi:hypothetical protein
MASDLLDELRGETPDAARVAQIQAALSDSLQPVAPLPSDRVLVPLLVTVFLILVVLCTMPFGFYGLRTFSWLQKIFYFGSLLFAAWSMAKALADQSIPGGRHRIPLPVQIILPVVLVALVTLLIFPQFGTYRFVRQGEPCLRIGLLCAIPAALILAIAMRRGFITDRLAAATTAGSFAGLFGIGVLALHCPIQNSAHILVWHFGVIVIAILAGAMLGWAADR